MIHLDHVMIHLDYVVMIHKNHVIIHQDHVIDLYHVATIYLNHVLLTSIVDIRPLYRIPSLKLK